MRVKMSKQPPSAPTVSAVGPCPTVIQISRTPRHWKFTQHHRTTRPPPPPPPPLLRRRLQPGRTTTAAVLFRLPLTRPLLRRRLQPGRTTTAAALFLLLQRAMALPQLVC